MSKLALVSVHTLSPSKQQTALPGRLDCLAMVGGDLAVGALLSQIVWWYLPHSETSKKKAWGVVCKKDGHRYIYNTREQWMAQTGLTLDRYKRALSVLKKRGWIEVRIMRVQGVPTTHIRLNVTAVTAVFLSLDDPQIAPKVEKPPKVTEENPPIHLVAFPPHPCTENTYKITPQIWPSPDLEKDSGKDGSEEEGMNAKEILDRHKSREAPISLPSVWKRYHALHWGDLATDLTIKEKAQLKMIGKLLGVGVAKDIILFVMENWTKFSTTATDAAGVGLRPGAPNIGFLLKHRNVAAQLLGTVMLPKSVQPLATESVVLTKMVPSHSQPIEVPHKLTEAEIQEMVVELENLSAT